LNYYSIDFGTTNQSYSIGISQEDINNNVFDWISVQPLIIKEDNITVNMDNTTDVSFEGGGKISLLLQINFTYNNFWVEVDNKVIKIFDICCSANHKDDSRIRFQDYVSLSQKTAKLKKLTLRTYHIELFVYSDNNPPIKEKYKIFIDDSISKPDWSKIDIKEYKGRTCD